MGMTASERTRMRKLQDRAIRAIELLFPNAAPEALEQCKVTAQPPAPTVAQARVTLYPELEWCWNEWVRNAEAAAINFGKRINKKARNEMEKDEILKVAKNMRDNGGSFVSRLGAALFYADDVNACKIRDAWPECWRKYGVNLPLPVAEKLGIACIGVDWQAIRRARKDV